MPSNPPTLNDQNIINPPCLTADTQGRPWMIAALFGEKNDFHNGHVIAGPATDPSANPAEISSPTTPLILVTPEPGAFSPPQATFDAKGRLWIAFTQSFGGDQRVILASLDENKRPVAPRELTQYGKFGHPTLAAIDNALWVAWERHEASGSFIEAVRLDLATGAEWALSPADVKQRTLTPPTGRAYRPQLTPDGQGGLYMVYEAFQGGRYRLIAAALDPASIDSDGTHPECGAILSAVEIGFPEHNDMEASACALDGRLLIAWENSRPLRKGDKMIGTTIPAFGHGWRFETRMGLRRVAFDGQRWQVENLQHAESPRIELDDATSSGCPRVSADDEGRIFLSWVAFTAQPHGWAVRLAQRNGTAWSPVHTPEQVMRKRVRPATNPVAESAPTQSVFSTANDWRTITPEAMVDKPAQRPVIEHEGKPLSLYWGDLHMHSNLSICSLHSEFHCTELEDKYRFTRDVGAMDFAMITDHDCMIDRDWARTSHAADLFNLPGGFVAYTGYEWTSSMQTDRHNYGHYCVLYLKDGPLLRIDEADGDTIEKVWANIPKGESLTIPHHPSDSTHPLDWNFFNPDFEPLIEIFQVRGSDEYDACPLEPTQLGRGVLPGNSVRAGLKRGYRFGFTSGGEHEGVGVTGVYAEDLTRVGIFEALKKRHTFGTTGARFFVEFRVGGHLMGECFKAKAQPAISIRIKSESPIANLRLVRDGDNIMEWTGLGVDVNLEWTDETMKGEALAKNHYYYIVATREDGEMAWASPVFLEGE